MICHQDDVFQHQLKAASNSFENRYVCRLTTSWYDAVYVIFGAAGAVGSDLVSRLAQQQGATVVASDRDHADLEQVKSATEMLPADVQDEEAVSPPYGISSTHLVPVKVILYRAAHHS